MDRQVLIRPPIILEGDGGPLFFPSAARLESYVEAIDVRRGEYRACYDSEGRLLNLRVVPKLLFGRFRTGTENIVVEYVEEGPGHAAELRLALIKCLGKLSVSSDWLQSASLEELVRKGVERLGLR